MNSDYVGDGRDREEDESSIAISDCSSDCHVNSNSRKFGKIARSQALYIVSYLCWVWLGYLTHSLNVSFMASLYFCSVNSESFSHCILYILMVCPLSICISSVKRMIENYRALWIALSMVSFLPVFFTVPQFPQTLFIGIGMGSLNTIQYMEFIQEGPDMRRNALWAFLTGLIVLLFVRYSHYSMNPLFGVYTFAVFSFAVTLCCSIFLWYAENFEDYEVDEAQVLLKKASPSRKLYMSFSNNIEEVMEEEDKDQQNTQIESSRWRTYLPEVGVGACFGSCLFVLNMFFTGYSVIPRWAGLEPFPYALVSVFCLTLGIIFGAVSVLHNIFSWIIIVVAVGLLCFANPTPAFLGGCLIAFCTPPFLFASVDLINHNNLVPACMSSVIANFSLSIFVRFVSDPNYSHFVFFGRPWIPLLISCLCLGLSFCHGGPGGDRLSSKGWKNMLRFPPRIVFLSLFLATAIGFLPSTMVRAGGKVPLPRSRPIIPLTPIGIKLSNSNYTSDDSDIPPKPFSVVQLNIRQGYDESGINNLDRLLEFFYRNPHPNIVGLQEVETNYMWTGTLDIVEFLSYKLHMYTVYGSNPRDSSLGAAILTKFQIENYDDQCFSSTSLSGSPKSCAFASVRFANRTSLSPLEIFVTQIRQDDDDLRYSENSDIAPEMNGIPPGHAIIWLGEVRFVEDRSPSSLLRQLNYVSCRRSDSQGSEYQFFRNLLANSTTCGDSLLSSHVPISTTFSF